MSDIENLLNSSINNNDSLIESPESPSSFNTDDTNSIKSLYQELADKEHALILAAQFGKNLIDEKEELEKQIESIKRDQQNQIESLEQESYVLKRLIESMRNEYEAKIYELNEDVSFLNRKLKQKDQCRTNQLQSQNEQLELIQELTENNQKLIDEIKSKELKLSIEEQNRQIVESKLSEKEKILNDNSKLLNNFQKEINKLINKQSELEYSLMQTCNERDKQKQILDELTNKYIYIENEKNDLEHLMYQNENEIITLRRLNQDLLYKLEKLENLNTLNRKRRTTNKLTLDSIERAQINCTNSNNANTLKMKSSYFNTNSSKNRYLNQQQCYLKSSSASLSNLANENNRFGSSISDTNSEFDDTECSSMNNSSILKINEIEQDDDDVGEDDESLMYTKNIYIDTEFIGGVNWQQETFEHQLQEEDTPANSNNNNNNNSEKTDDLILRNFNSDSNFKTNTQQTSQLNNCLNSNETSLNQQKFTNFDNNNNNNKDEIYNTGQK